MTIWEVLFVGSAVAVLGGYHLHFFHQLRRAPRVTTVGRAREYRRAWVAGIVERRDGILAVQTLRNWSMSASFLASTAIIIAAGLLGFMFSADKTSALIHEFNLLGSQSPRLLTLKLILLVGDFLATFFSFSLCLRYYNYAALTINTAGIDDNEELVELSADYLERAANHFTLGMRGYYFAVPLTLWVFGPIWLLLGAAGLTAALHRHDHAV